MTGHLLGTVTGASSDSEVVLSWALIIDAPSSLATASSPGSGLLD